MTHTILPTSLEHALNAIKHLRIAVDELQEANKNASPLAHLLLMDLLKSARELSDRARCVMLAMDKQPDADPPEEERE